MKGVRMKLIQDIIPPSQLSYDTVEEKPPVKRLSSDTLMNELWERGVSIQTIFGRFYELEAIADARSDEIFGNDEEGHHGRPRLTVGDAELAGAIAPQPEKPLTR